MPGPKILYATFAILVAVLAVAAPPARAGSNAIAIAPIKEVDVAKAIALNTPDNHERYLRLHKLFDFAGCSPASMQELKVPHAAEPDLICTLSGVLTPASDPDPQRVLVIARYDHIGQGAGAIDNWSGAAMLPLVYASLLPGYREHTIQFAAVFGPNGLHAFLKTLTRQQKEATIALVDLRDVGMEAPHMAVLYAEGSGGEGSMLDKGNTSGIVTKAMRDTSASTQSAARTAQNRSETGALNETDIRLFARRQAALLIRTSLPALGDPYLEGFLGAKPQTSKDETDFILESGIPAVVIHSITKANAAIPGSKEDSLERVNQSAYYDTYYYTSVYLLVLDHPSIAHPAPRAPAK